MRALALALIACLCASCVTTTVTRIDSNEYPETDVYDIELFSTEAEVSAPFDALGVVEIRNHGGLASEGETLRQATEQAAQIGANGLVLNPTAAGESDDTIKMLAIRVHYDRSELQRAFTADGEDVRRIQVKSFEEWVGDDEEEEPPPDPQVVEDAIELTLGLIFPAQNGRVRYDDSARTLTVRFATPADYEIDYDDAFGRLRNNQWIALQQFDLQEIPVDKVIAETNDLNGRGQLRAISTATDVRELARLPAPEPWRAATKVFVRTAPRGDWVLLAN